MKTNNLLIIFEIVLLIISVLIVIFIYIYLKLEKEKFLNIIKILSSILFVSLIGFIIQLVQLKQNEYKNRAELIQIFYRTLLSNDNNKIKKSLILIQAIDPILYKKIESLQYKNINSIEEIIKIYTEVLTSKNNSDKMDKLKLNDKVDKNSSTKLKKLLEDQK